MIKNYLNFINESFSDLIKDGENVKEITDLGNIPALLSKFEKFKIDEYIVIPRNGDRISCMIARVAPRSKFGYKIELNYHYRSIEQMVKSVTQFFSDRYKWKKQKLDYKENKQKQQEEGLSNINELIKVGDIFYSSWGYDQTNVDFYQVLDVSDKGTVSLREIGSEIVDGTTGMDCANLRPVKDDFKSNEVFKKRATFTNGSVRLGGGYRSLYKYTQGDRGVYCSWYH